MDTTNPSYARRTSLIAAALLANPDILDLTCKLLVADVRERFKCAAGVAHTAIEKARLRRGR